MILSKIKLILGDNMDTLKDYSILYAEDESIIRINIAQQLEAFFQKVIVAKEGEDALHLFKQKNLML